jgi:hypothetical protein
MTTDHAPSTVKPTRSRKVVILVLVLLVGIVALGGLFLIVTRSIQLPTLDGRIENAIRTTFPAFCSWPGNRMIITYAATVQGSDFYYISCDPNPAPWKENFVMMNVATCEVMPPLTRSLEWHDIYSKLYGQEGPIKMTVCP